MKLKHGDRELDWNALLDTPRLQSAALLLLFNPGDAVTLRTTKGDELVVRVNDVEPLLRQTLHAA